MIWGVVLVYDCQVSGKGAVTSMSTSISPTNNTHVARNKISILILFLIDTGFETNEDISQSSYRRSSW